MIIYNESLGNAKLIYSAYSETDMESNKITYSISVKNMISKTEATVRGLTNNKDTAIEFVETLVRNTVYPETLRDVAEDFLLA